MVFMAYYHSFLLFSFIIISLSRGGSGNTERAPSDWIDHLFNWHQCLSGLKWLHHLTISGSVFNTWKNVRGALRTCLELSQELVSTIIWLLPHSQSEVSTEEPPVEELHLYLSTAIYQNNLIVFILCLGWALAGYFPVCLHNVLILNLTLHTYLLTHTSALKCHGVRGHNAQYLYM